jgi:hypothetical protein
MKKIFLLLLPLLALFVIAQPARAQATAATASSVVCAADGSSTQVLAAKFSRESYVVSNTSGGTIRLGFLASGTADLTDSNSIQLLAGQIFTDSAPGIYVGRVVCMNNAAGAATVYVIETRRP